MPQSFSSFGSEISIRKPFDESFSKEDYCSIQEHLNRARMFADVAENEFLYGRWATFVVNAFAAAEIIAKAEMLLSPYLGRKNYKKLTRKKIFELYRRCAEAGEVTRELYDILCKLHGKYPGTKYLKEVVTIDDELAQNTMNVINRKIRVLEKETRKSQV